MYSVYMAGLRFKVQVLNQSAILTSPNLERIQISWGYNMLGLEYIAFRSGLFQSIYCGSFSLLEPFKH